MTLYSRRDSLAAAYTSSCSCSVISKLQRCQPSENEMEITELIQQACQEGYLDTVRYLLSRCDIDLATYSSLALSSAVQRNQVQVVKLLLEDSRIDPTANNCHVVYQAAKYGYTQIVNVLLNDTRAVSSGGRQAAFDGAVEYGSYFLFEQLLDCSSDVVVNPAKNDNRAIQQAASRNDVRMIRRLLQDTRVDPSAKNNEALVRAACMGHVHAVHVLVRDSRIYNDGTIPAISQQRAQGYYNSAETATKLVRHAVLCMLAGGDIPFDVASTFSSETIAAVDVKQALQASHDSSLATVNQVKLALLDTLCEDVVTDILCMLVGNSIYPWQSAVERKANLRMLVSTKETH